MKVLTAVILIAVFVTALFFAFFILQFDPNALIPYFEKDLSSFLGGKVKIRSLSVEMDFNPRFLVKQFKLLDPKTSELILESEKGSASIELWSILKRRLTLNELTFENPRIRLKREENRFNLALISPPESVPGNIPPKVDIQFLKLENAEIVYSDLSRQPALEWRFPPMTLRFKKTKPGEDVEFQVQLNQTPFEGALADIRIEPRHDRAAMHFYQATMVDLQTEVNGLSKTPAFQMKGHIQHFPGTLQYPVAVDGLWNAEFEAAGDGFHPEQLKRGLLLKSKVKVEQGVVRNVNFVRQLLVNLSPIPGFIKLTQGEFPGVLGEIYQGKGTPFEFIEGAVQLSEGKIDFEDLLIQHPLYKIQIHGYLNLLENRFDFRGAVVFEDPFGRILMERVEAMDVLQDPQGHIVIPFSYSGHLSQQAEATPDLHYIANRLVQFRGEQLASQGIQKINDFLEAHR